MSAVAVETGFVPVEVSVCGLGDRAREYDRWRHLLPVGHTYQPPRTFPKLSTVLSDAPVSADVVASINHEIHEQCYRKVLVEGDGFPPGMMFSFYGTLREWMKSSYPDDFARIVEKAKSDPQSEYQILGDSYLHLILPLETPETQDLLVKAGLQAFEQDMGFRPKGFWLPETAVSRQTLGVLAQNGIEFVVLRDSQVGAMQGKVAYADLGDRSKRIAIVVVDSDVSGSVSFEDRVTANAEAFLENERFSNRHDLAWASDMELWGHHGRWKDRFLKYVTRPDVQAAHGVVPFDIELELARLAADPKFVTVYDNSSWSCEHSLGRWTGDCRCDWDRNSASLDYKKELWGTISGYGEEIDRKLDAADPEWRARFPGFFLGVRQSMYGKGDFRQSVAELSAGPGFGILQDPNVRTLYLAELARLTGTTSCFNFFGGGPERVERQIAQINIGEIEKLVPGIAASRQSQLQLAA